jgi:large subunit ribosomal protein L18
MNKIERRLRRKRGIRKKIFGTAVKPRISVFRSNKHIYVQAVDDEAGRTLAHSSDAAVGKKKSLDGATAVGELLAQELVKKEIKQGVFDRNGYLYHGLVKAVAEGVRKGGVKV